MSTAAPRAKRIVIAIIRFRLWRRMMYRQFAERWRLFQSLRVERGGLAAPPKRPELRGDR